jgi:putative drug exporter of the RND superfamily
MPGPWGPRSAPPGDRRQLAEGLAIRLRADGLQEVLVTGALPAREAQADAIARRLHLVEAATLLLVLLAVVLYTRSAAVPLVALAAVTLSYLVAIRLAAAAGEQLGVSVPSEVEPVVVALLFGVVTDYVIFSFSRFRRHVAEGLGGRAAAERSATELAPILTACGMAVAAACLALLAAELGFLRAFGPGVALAVLVGLLVALTFVPACFAILGTRLLWPSRPPRARWATGAERRLRWVVAHPRRSAAGALAVLAVLASGALWLDVGNPVIRGLPADSEVRRGYEAAAAGLAPGVVAPTVVLVEGERLDRRRAALADLQRTLANQPGVAAVLGPALNPTDRAFGALLTPDGRAARYVLVLDDDPLGGRAVRLTGNLDDRLGGLLSATGLDGARASLAGDTALTAETVDRAGADLHRILPLALVAVALVLALFLRAIVAPLYLVLVAVLPPLASLGVAVVVLQGAFGIEELTFFSPIAAGVLLVALGSDYNVFLAGRIWAEARDLPLEEAVVRGGAGAARAIAAAGLILAASFVALALVPVQPFRELALLVGVGLLLDAFLVRSVLVPALVVLVGRRSGWPGRGLRPLPD